jgi:8-oxo-dGTP diphosphatase
VILVDIRGWILLQERDEHPAIDPEKWGLVGGHLDPGEGFETAAYRELAEETGLRLPVGALRGWQEIEFFQPATRSAARMRVFVAATELTDADIDVLEGRQIVFVEPGAARELDLGVAAAIAVPTFLDSAEYRELAGRTAADPIPGAGC